MDLYSSIFIKRKRHCKQDFCSLPCFLLTRSKLNMKMNWLSIFNRQYSLITTHFLCANLLAVCNSFQSNMSSMCLTLLRKNEQILTWGTFPDPGICWHLLTSADYLEFCLDACKKRRYLRVFQKIEEVWCEQNPVNNSVLSTSKDKNCGIYPGSCHLTAQNVVNYGALCAVYVQFLNERCFHMFLAFFN